MYIDGTKRSAQALPCDYSYAVPCSNPSSAQTLSVNLAATSGGTRVIPDGTHSVQVAAVDAAGNETRSNPRSIAVDATAPAAPAALASSIGSSWQTSRDVTATWTHPSGQVAPIDTAHWSFCPSGSSSGCVTGSAPVSGSTGTLAGLQVPGEGEWDLSLRLQDAAGNTASGNVARTTVRYDATAPVASPNLAVSSIRKDTEQELVAYFNPPSGQQAPVTEALWSLCRQGSTTGCSAGTLTADPSSTNTLRTAVPAHGDWTLSVRLRDQAGNVGPPATTTLRYVAAPTPAPTSTPAPSPTATPSPSSPAKPAPRRRAGLRVGSAVLDRSRRTLTVKGTTAAGAAGRVRLMITATRNGRTRTSSRVTAIRRGRFVARLSLSRGDARARLRISAVYDGSSTHLPDRAPRRLVRVR